jgi:PAS domain S-box-containing protein
MTGLNPDTKEEFRALIEHSTDIISVLDKQGRIRYQSPSIERILGYEQGEILGDGAFEYVHPDDRETVAALFTEMVEEQRSRTQRVEFRFRHADGSWVWLEAIGSNRTDTSLEGYVVNSRDVTERRERETQLERQNERLEEFTSIVSHDLRNPLNVVGESLELYRETGEGDHYDRCVDALDRMEQLIEDLFELARQGETVADTEPVALADAASQAWEVAAPSQADLTVVDEPRIEADPARLGRLLENLFENAAEHATDADARTRTCSGTGTAERGDEVSVTLGRMETETGAGTEAEAGAGFYVADDGQGIPEAECNRVFDPGYSTADDGTGYGLRIVDRIAEAHGWDVAVTDSARGGARFEVTGVEFA